MITFLKKFHFVFLLELLVFSTTANAQLTDSIDVNLNKKQFQQGDSISFEVNLKNYKSIAKLATIQLWIEEIKTGKKWNFRYPLVNGYLAAGFQIGDGINDGTYAFNFLLQKKFFSLTGKAQNVKNKDKALSYVMISKNNQAIVDVIALNEQHSFSLGNLLFQDSAFIVFSKPKTKNNDLLIDIQTPLDSAFIPSALATQFITIGKNEAAANQQQQITKGYNFLLDDAKYKTIMPEVVVKSVSHKKMEDFNRDNTTGLFSGNDAILLDGLGSDDIANAPDLYTYLTIKVGGLKLETDNQSGGRFFTWRGQPTDIFINEIKLDQDVPVPIDVADIAMIKIFRPGTSVTGGSGKGGAIAIYTKTGPDERNNKRKYSFYIKGYAALNGNWQ